MNIKPMNDLKAQINELKNIQQSTAGRDEVAISTLCSTMITSLESIYSELMKSFIQDRALLVDVILNESQASEVMRMDFLDSVGRIDPSKVDAYISYISSNVNPDASPSP